MPIPFPDFAEVEIHTGALALPATAVDLYNAARALWNNLVMGGDIAAADLYATRVRDTGIWEQPAAADLHPNHAVDGVFRTAVSACGICNCYTYPTWWLIKSGSCQLHP